MPRGAGGTPTSNTLASGVQAGSSISQVSSSTAGDVACATSCFSSFSAASPRRQPLPITGRKPDARIFVRGDKGIDYGTVMQVVRTINQAGFSKVALLTEVPAAGRPRDAAATSPAP